jgi:thiamine transporter
MTEIALSIALAAVLHLVFKVWQMPFGGSISLEMLPIIIVALRRGVLAGVLAGVLFGVIDYFMEPFFVHWVQLLLDYPVAFGCVGLAGLMRPLAVSAFRAGKPGRVVWTAVVPAVVIGGLARFGAHLVSGAIFFGANAPAGQNVWLYSAVYNATYVLPSVVACGVVAAILVPVLERAVPTPATT